jgi:ammonium transporter Rh
MDDSRRQTIEYKFLRQNTYHTVPRMRYSVSAYLITFQVAFVGLFAWFASYKAECSNGTCRGVDSKTYTMFMDVHSMMFVGFGFLMTFLKRYGYGSIGFNFLIAAYTLQWSLLVRGWLDSGYANRGQFEISTSNLLIADLSTAAVLISFGAVIGKASLSQLVVMATGEVVIQSLNEYIGVNYLQAYDVGESIYVHVFGAYFGLAVSRVLQSKKIVESTKENSHYHSDLFSMIGTVFLWIYWPSFNSATARDEGQVRAVINTYLAIASSCVSTYVVSLFVGRGRLNMIHVQNATLAGGVAVGAIADMVIQPYGAMVIGTLAGVLSTMGFHYMTPLLNHRILHDTCGVNNLHGMPGIMSGIASAVVAATATRESYNGNRLYVFYPSRLPMANSTEFKNHSLSSFPEFVNGGLGRSGVQQGGYQMAALATTLLTALVGGVLTGFLMRLPIIEQVKENEEMFDDEPQWVTPEDYSLKLTEVRVQQQTTTRNGAEEEEMKGLRTSHA